MNGDDDQFENGPPWFKLGLDLDGAVAAAGAFLVALLLGWLWWPLFWIGFAGVVLALLAARWSRRSPPDLADAILAPCDGVVVSVTPADTPLDLHLDDVRALRIRIASSPSVTNRLYSPINGGIESVNVEAGDPSVPFATRPDEAGLASAALVLQSQNDRVGLRFLTGGFGPRLEVNVSPGDVVRLGRVVGTRRLGGWCDLYLPEAAGVMVWPGQTLVGGETVVGRFRDEPVDAETEEPKEALDALERAIDDEVEEPVIEERREPDAIDELFDDDVYPEPDEVDVSDDPAVIFARIREASRKHGESD